MIARNGSKNAEKLCYSTRQLGLAALLVFAPSALFICVWRQQGTTTLHATCCSTTCCSDCSLQLPHLLLQLLRFTGGTLNCRIVTFHACHQCLALLLW
jgi:hypothetical protein